MGTHPSGFKSLKMDWKWGRYGAGTREGSIVIFSKKIEANYHSSSSCVFCIAPLLLTLKRTFCSPPVQASSHTKIAQFD
jgi:hypothetical protein